MVLMMAVQGKGRAGAGRRMMVGRGRGGTGNTRRATTQRKETAGKVGVVRRPAREGEF